MYLEVTEQGRVFLRRDIGKHRLVHKTNQGKTTSATVYDPAPSHRERDDADRLIEMIRAVFRGKGVTR